MNLHASPGRVIMKLWNAPSKSKLVMPENVSIEEFPTYEVLDVGVGKESPYSGQREVIPYKMGDRVIAMSARCVILEVQGEKLFVTDWTNIYGKVTD